MFSFRFFPLFFSLVPLLFLTGCSPKANYAIVTIEGTASFNNGTPLPDSCTLEFNVGDYRSSLGKIGPGGTFKTMHTPEINGVPVGTAKVRILWNAEGDPPQEYATLLEKYGYISEGLEVEITKSDKNFKIEFP